jgi:hypothetical protein
MDVRMTQNDIDIIYDYLHENYDYHIDGHLIHKFDLLNKSKIKGQQLGSFFHQTASEPYLMSSVTVNKKRYRMKLIKLIFIYHNKSLPSRLYQIDKNPMNTRIENLEESNQSLIQHKSLLYKKFDMPKFKNKDGTEGHSVRTKYDGKSLDLGTYRTKEIAQEVYRDAKKLILDDKLNANEIKKIIAKKYPESSLNILAKTGFKGVSIRGNKFASVVCINGKKVYLGIFDTANDAHKAYLKAKDMHKK